jgi:hypothetical protein
VGFLVPTISTLITLHYTHRAVGNADANAAVSMRDNTLDTLLVGSMAACAHTCISGSRSQAAVHAGCVRHVSKCLVMVVVNGKKSAHDQRKP